MATQIVLRPSNTMKLEDQGNSKKRTEAAIKERAVLLKNGDLKILWN
jgi:hypothetical protein